MDIYIQTALQFIATTYGFNEHYCGDYDQPPQPCQYGAITASGDVFDPNIPTAAVPLPRNRILRETYICLVAHDGTQHYIKINDKKHERYIGNSGLDLSPAAVELLTGKEAKPYWSGKVTACETELAQAD